MAHACQQGRQIDEHQRREDRTGHIAVIEKDHYRHHDRQNACARGQAQVDCSLAHWRPGLMAAGPFLGSGRPGGKVGGERGQVRVGPCGECLAGPRGKLVHGQPALHERGFKRLHHSLAVGMRRQEAAVAPRACCPLVSRSRGHRRLPASKQAKSVTRRFSVRPSAPPEPVLASPAGKASPGPSAAEQPRRPSLRTKCIVPNEPWCFLYLSATGLRRRLVSARSPPPLPGFPEFLTALSACRS